MCMTGKDFIDDLADAKKMECTVFDEAGELDSRRAMSNFNVMLTQAYKVIRSDLLYTILVLPDFWDLESRFRNRRVKFLIHVYQRGRCAVWLKDNVRKINELNKGRLIKTPYLVKPDFFDTFPIYKGPMAEAYEEMKTRKTRETRKKLKEEFNKSANDLANFKKEIAKKMYEDGVFQAKIAGYMGVTQKTISNWLKDLSNSRED